MCRSKARRNRKTVTTRHNAVTRTRSARFPTGCLGCRQVVERLPAIQVSCARRALRMNTRQRKRCASHLLLSNARFVVIRSVGAGRRCTETRFPYAREALVNMRALNGIVGEFFVGGPANGDPLTTVAGGKKIAAGRPGPAEHRTSWGDRGAGRAGAAAIGARRNPGRRVSPGPAGISRNRSNSRRPMTKHHRCAAWS